MAGLAFLLALVDALVETIISAAEKAALAKVSFIIDVGQCARRSSRTIRILIY
jgi:hypothetical protein